MSLIALPLIVGATREALQSIPRHVREASYALGKDRVSTIRRVLLPGVAARDRAPGSRSAWAGSSATRRSSSILLGASLQTRARRATSRSSALLKGTGSTLTSYVYNNSPAGEGERAREGLRRRLRPAADRDRPQLRRRPDRPREGGRSMDPLSAAAGAGAIVVDRAAPTAGRRPPRRRGDRQPRQRQRPRGCAGVRAAEAAPARRRTVGRADADRGARASPTARSSRSTQVSLDGPPGRGAGPDRPLGLRQDDPAALAQPARRPDPDRDPQRPHPARRRGRRPLRRHPACAAGSGCSSSSPTRSR